LAQQICSTPIEIYKLKQLYNIIEGEVSQ